jgi:hypothetical protein
MIRKPLRGRPGAERRSTAIGLLARIAVSRSLLRARLKSPPSAATHRAGPNPQRGRACEGKLGAANGPTKKIRSLPMAPRLPKPFPAPSTFDGARPAVWSRSYTRPESLSQSGFDSTTDVVVLRIAGRLPERSSYLVLEGDQGGYPKGAAAVQILLTGARYTTLPLQRQLPRRPAQPPRHPVDLRRLPNRSQSQLPERAPNLSSAAPSQPQTPSPPAVPLTPPSRRTAAFAQATHPTLGPQTEPTSAHASRLITGLRRFSLLRGPITVERSSLTRPGLRVYKAQKRYRDAKSRS